MTKRPSNAATDPIGRPRVGVLVAVFAAIAVVTAPAAPASAALHGDEDPEPPDPSELPQPPAPPDELADPEVLASDLREAIEEQAPQVELPENPFEPVPEYFPAGFVFILLWPVPLIVCSVDGDAGSLDLGYATIHYDLLGSCDDPEEIRYEVGQEGTSGGYALNVRGSAFWTVDETARLSGEAWEYAVTFYEESTLDPYEPTETDIPLPPGPRTP
jgi:hypothetical protein